jgi:DnaK suppressor protein
MAGKKATSRKRVAAKGARKASKKRSTSKKSSTRRAVSSRKTTAKKAASKRTKTRAVSKKKASKKASAKKAVKKKPAAKKTAKKTSVKRGKTAKKAAKKPGTKKAPAKKKPAKKQTAKASKKKPSAKKTAVKKATGTAAQMRGKRPASKKATRSRSLPPAKRMVSSDTLIHGIVPYRSAAGEDYMSDTQLEHFRRILLAWKQELMEEVDRTVHHMQDEASNFPDPNDRATQESEFGLELRTRDRERKLLKKIDSALQRIEDGSYGFCEETGEEIGLKRLEARPVATLCLEAQERRELAERQYRDRDDQYR